MRSSAAAGPFMRYFFRIFKASWNVDLSGQVGPEAITPRSSPATSEIIREMTVHDLSTCRSSWPPLTADRCLRTAFISCMVAPERRSWSVIFCLSSSDTPWAGSGIRAEPPPEIRTNTMSPRRALPSTSRIFPVPFTPALSGTG